MLNFSQSEGGFACAMLAVYLDSASNLPVSNHERDVLAFVLASGRSKRAEFCSFVCCQKDHSELTANQKHGKHPKESRVRPKLYYKVVCGCVCMAWCIWRECITSNFLLLISHECMSFICYQRSLILYSKKKYVVRKKLFFDWTWVLFISFSNVCSV